MFVWKKYNINSNDVSPDTDLTLKSGDKYKSLGNIQTYRLVNYDLTSIFYISI